MSTNGKSGAFFLPLLTTVLDLGYRLILGVPLFSGDTMARVTVEDCLQNVENRFALVHLASSRVRQIIEGSMRLVNCDNKDIVTALREIAANKVLPLTVDTRTTNDDDLKIEIPEFK